MTISKEVTFSEIFDKIFKIVRVEKYYCKRNYQSIGGFWTVDKWQLGDTIVSLEDEGYTRRIVSINLGTNIIDTCDYLSATGRAIKVINGSLDHLHKILEKVQKLSISDDNTTTCLSVDTSTGDNNSEILPEIYTRKNLGAKLKESIDIEEKMRTEKERQSIIAATNAEIKKIEELRTFIRSVRQELVEKIESGSIEPAVIVDDYKNVEYINVIKYLDNTAYAAIPHADKFKKYWNEMLEYFLTEDIVISIEREHDGFGMKSWFTIIAKPK